MVGELNAAGDVVAVEMFVLQSFAPALDEALAMGGAVVGACLGQNAPGGLPVCGELPASS